MTWWAEQAATLDGARAAVWSDPDWEEGVEASLSACQAGMATKPGATVIDLGCGIGRVMAPMAKDWPRVHFVGIDVTPEMIEHARFQYHYIGNARWVVGDGRTLACQPGRIDSVYSMLVFQHLPPETVGLYLSDIANRLSAGGAFRFQWVVGDYHHGHDHRYPVDTMVGMARSAGFAAVDVEVGRMHEQWAWMTATTR